MILIKPKDFSFTLEVFKDYTNSGLQKVFPSLYGYGASSGCGFWEWSFWKIISDLWIKDNLVSNPF